MEIVWMDYEQPLRVKKNKYIFNEKSVRRPGIEPGSQEWESCMIPLHQRRAREGEPPLEKPCTCEQQSLLPRGTFAGGIELAASWLHVSHFSLDIDKNTLSLFEKNQICRRNLKVFLKRNYFEKKYYRSSTSDYRTLNGIDISLLTVFATSTHQLRLISHNRFNRFVR